MTNVVKRLLDLVIASVVLLVASPLLLAIWVAVRVTSPGPAIFRQERLGRNERPFKMLKFRTMWMDNSDAEHRAYVKELLAVGADGPTHDGGLYKLTGDNRITRIGKWLRRLSLDELPQLFNVLRGEMSLVGPRPVLDWEAELFNQNERIRFHVKPGLTGLWQVSGRSRLSMRDALRLDIEYVRRQSLVFDLILLARTVPALLRRGAA